MVENSYCRLCRPPTWIAPLAFAIGPAACAPASEGRGWAHQTDWAQEFHTEAAQTPALPEEPLRVLAGAPREWLNTAPIDPSQLRGKVVLVNFWTYSCINSLRTLPYLRTWAEKYKDRGLVVIGVHTPEFGFEQELDRVRMAVAGLPVRYPVVLDNDYAIWNAFGNNAWPGFYFVDASGRVRHRVLGETGYDESERWIQKLLSEVDGAPSTQALVDVAGTGAQAAPDWDDLRTPETYIGFARATGFASRGGAQPNVRAAYTVASNLSLNHWSLSGEWIVGAEYGQLAGPSGRIAFRFHARDLHLVLGRGAADSVRFRITLDGQAPGADHGADTDAAGWGSLDQDRMYQLVRQSGRIADRTFEIEFLSPGARAYSFTFG